MRLVTWKHKAALMKFKYAQKSAYGCGPATKVAELLLTLSPNPPRLPCAAGAGKLLKAA